MVLNREVLIMDKYDRFVWRAGILLMVAVVLGASTGTAEEEKALAGDVQTDCSGPAETSDLELTAPIARWDEAIPLGNGLLGGLLWGGEQTIKLSLDRGDLWDLRRPEIVQQPDWTFATMQRLVGEKNQAEMLRRFDEPYNEACPTKLPVARLELRLSDDQPIESFALNLRKAVGRARIKGGDAEVFFSAVEPVAMLRIPDANVQPKLIASDAVKGIGYPPAVLGNDAGCFWLLQETTQGLKYAVVAATRTNGTTTEMALTVASTSEGSDPVAVGRRRVAKALDKGYQAMLEPHGRWWDTFWSQSGVRVPDVAIQRQYDLVEYFYGAASRRGAPPMPLQGVWTADEGALPPWKGDYHHDLNTQLTYWAYLNAGHFEEGSSFLDFMWNLLPEHRKFAREFYDAPGAAVPGVMALDGKALGGWSQYALSVTNGAWVAQAFYQHWRYTMDRAFLVDRAYPYLTALGECYEALLKPGADGRLKLPLSSSPEIHDNSLAAWLTPNSNFDLALLKWHFGALVEMAAVFGDGSAVERWNAVASKLGDLAVDDSGALWLSPDESLAESHRHHSNLMAIHPLGLLTIEGSDRERKTIEASLAQTAQLGTRSWCGYSFSWMACLAARAGKPEMALDNLDIFVRAFISRNGFHLNGDQIGGKYANATYRPFTLEGNFAAAQAVHEMLLQSWGGTIRVFPAAPTQWADISFQDLRAEGAFSVSAQRVQEKTVAVKVRAGRDTNLRLRDPFDGKPTTWNKDGVQLTGQDYTCALKTGETLEGRITP